MTEEEQFVDLFEKHGDPVEAARRMFGDSDETPVERANRLMDKRLVKKLIAQRHKEKGGPPPPGEQEHLTPKEAMDELLRLYYQADSVKEKKELLTTYMKAAGHLDERIHVTQDSQDLDQIDWSVYTEEEVAQLEYLLSKGWRGD